MKEWIFIVVPICPYITPILVFPFSVPFLRSQLTEGKFRVEGFRHKGLRVEGFGVAGLGLRVQGFGFRG